uniref:Uncharacterized protein n=1 Tax=Stegastes partitus TaxID=144197 RepID=A0A3B4ZNC5_9TELE
MESKAYQNYHHDGEAAINQMINMEMFASSLIYPPVTAPCG